MQRRSISIKLYVWFMITTISLVATFIGLGWRVWAHLQQDDPQTLKDFFLFPRTPSPQQIDTIWQEMMAEDDVRRVIRAVIGQRLTQGGTDGARFKHPFFDLMPRIDWPTVVVTWSDLQSMKRAPDWLMVSSGSVQWSYVSHPEGDKVAFGPLPAFPGQICAVWEGVLGTAQRCQAITMDDVLQLFNDEVGENSVSSIQRWHLETATGPRFAQLAINAPSAIIRSDDGMTQVVRSGDLLGPLDIDGTASNRRSYVRFFAESPWGWISRAVSVADETITAHHASSISVHLPYLDDTRVEALGNILARHLASVDMAFQKQDVHRISDVTPALRDAYRLYVTESSEGLRDDSTNEHDKDVMGNGFLSWRLEIESAHVCYDEDRLLWQVEMRIRTRLPSVLEPMLSGDGHHGTDHRQEALPVLRARLVYESGQWLVDDLVQEETVTTKDAPDPSIVCPLGQGLLVDSFIPKASLMIPTWQMLIIGMDRPLVMFGEEASGAALNAFLSKMQAYGTRLWIQDWTWPSLEKKLMNGEIDLAVGVMTPQDANNWIKQAESLGQPAPVWVALYPEGMDSADALSPLYLMISGHDRGGFSRLLKRFQEAGYAVRIDDQRTPMLHAAFNPMISSD